MSRWLPHRYRWPGYLILVGILVVLTLALWLGLAWLDGGFDLSSRDRSTRKTSWMVVCLGLADAMCLLLVVHGAIYLLRRGLRRRR